jgi:hypothetical protein
MHIPDFRTTKYAIWSACERFGILPPDVKPEWDDNGAWAQAELIAYDMIKSHDEMDLQISSLRARPQRL